MAAIETLNIIQQNVLSWRTHKTQLKQIYSTLNPHLILINSHGCKEGEDIKIYNYNISQKNFSNGPHDGVAMGVRRDLSYQWLPLTDMMAVRVGLAHEEIIVATGYCPFRRPSLPVADFLKLMNMNVPVYIIGDLNIKSVQLGEGYNNCFGNQFNVLYRTGKIRYEGPHFPTYFGARSATTPDKIFTNNKAYFNIHAAPGPDTSSDHSIVLVKISCGPIRVEMKERRCVRKTDWVNFKKDLESLKIDPLEGKPTEAIDEALKNVTEAMQGAIDRRVPKIKMRTLPHPDIDDETKNMMEEAGRIKTLLSLNINYIENKRRLNALREIIRERWWRKNTEKWSNLIEKIDLKNDKKRVLV